MLFSPCTVLGWLCCCWCFCMFRLVIIQCSQAHQMFLWLPCSVSVRPPLPLDQVFPFIPHLLVSKDLLHSVFLIIIDRTQPVVWVVCTLPWFKECDMVCRMYVVPCRRELQSVCLLFHCVGDLKQSNLLVI